MPSHPHVRCAHDVAALGPRLQVGSSAAITGRDEVGLVSRRPAAHRIHQFRRCTPPDAKNLRQLARPHAVAAPAHERLSSEWPRGGSTVLAGRPALSSARVEVDGDRSLDVVAFDQTARESHQLVTQGASGAIRKQYQLSFVVRKLFDQCERGAVSFGMAFPTILVNDQGGHGDGHAGQRQLPRGPADSACETGFRLAALLDDDGSVDRPPIASGFERECCARL